MNYNTKQRLKKGLIFLGLTFAIGAATMYYTNKHAEHPEVISTLRSLEEAGGKNYDYHVTYFASDTARIQDCGPDDGVLISAVYNLPTDTSGFAALEENHPSMKNEVLESVRHTNEAMRNAAEVLKNTAKQLGLEQHKEIEYLDKVGLAGTGDIEEAKDVTLQKSQQYMADVQNGINKQHFVALCFEKGHARPNFLGKIAPGLDSKLTKVINYGNISPM